MTTNRTRTKRIAMQKTAKTNEQDRQAIKLDPDLRTFLRETATCQCLALAAWATKLLRAGSMTMTDLERCLNLGFEF